MDGPLNKTGRHGENLGRVSRVGLASKGNIMEGIISELVEIANELQSKKTGADPGSALVAASNLLIIRTRRDLIDSIEGVGAAIPPNPSDPTLSAGQPPVNPSPERSDGLI